MSKEQFFRKVKKVRKRHVRKRRPKNAQNNSFNCTNSVPYYTVPVVNNDTMLENPINITDSKFSKSVPFLNLSVDISLSNKVNVINLEKKIYRHHLFEKNDLNTNFANNTQQINSSNNYQSLHSFTKFIFNTTFFLILLTYFSLIDVNFALYLFVLSFNVTSLFPFNNIKFGIPNKYRKLKIGRRYKSLKCKFKSFLINCPLKYGYNIALPIFPFTLSFV